MRDKTHQASIEKWARFMLKNRGKWKKIHTEFINSQFQKHDKFLKKLIATPGGKEKIIKLYGIKNLKGYSGLFK